MVLVNFSFQIIIHFFRNKNNPPKPGVVVEPLDEKLLKNSEGENKPKSNHVHRPRSQNAYKRLDYNGPMDEKLQPIKKIKTTAKKTAVPDQMHEASSATEEQENT